LNQTEIPLGLDASQPNMHYSIKPVAGLLIYSGNDIVQLGDKIYAAPWHILTGVGKSSF